MRVGELNYLFSEIKKTGLSANWCLVDIANVRSKILEINRYIEIVDGVPKIKLYCDGRWVEHYDYRWRFSGWYWKGSELSWPLLTVDFCMETAYLLISIEKGTYHYRKAILDDKSIYEKTIFLNPSKKSELIERLIEFYSFYSHSQKKILPEATLKLPTLIAALRDFTLTLCKANTDREYLMLDIKILEDLNKRSKSIINRLYVCYNNHVSQIRPDPDYLFLYLKYLPHIIRGFEYFNSWFDAAEPISLQAFKSTSLKEVQADWDFILHSLFGTVYYWYLLRLEPRIQALIASYYHYLETRLKHLRADASQAQIEQTLLHERLLGMEKTFNELNLDDMDLQRQILAILDQPKQDVLYQKALNQIAAVCKYNKNLQTELKKLPPETKTGDLFRAIANCSDIKMIKKPICAVTSPEKKEKKERYPELSDPTIITDLLDLETLLVLNKLTTGRDLYLMSSFPAEDIKVYRNCYILAEKRLGYITLSGQYSIFFVSIDNMEKFINDIKPFNLVAGQKIYLSDNQVQNLITSNGGDTKTTSLLSALERTSFWISKKEKFRTKLISLIKNFNSCFKIENLKEEVRLEKANIFLQDLMRYIQCLPGLASIVENEYDIHEKLKDFLILYDQIMKESLAAIQRQYELIQASSLKLRKKIQFLEDEIKQGITAPTEFKKLARENPYKEALFEVARLILNAKTDYPSSLVPILMMILKFSYDGLNNIPKMEQKTQPFGSQLTADISNFESLSSAHDQKIAISMNLPWKSLKFIYQYSHIVLGKYTGYNPGDNWSLWWAGVTDRAAIRFDPVAAAWGDRQTQYIHFCARLKKMLTSFNENFLETSSPVEDKIIDKANGELRQWAKEIEDLIGTDSISYALYKIVQNEKEKQKKNIAEKPFLGWERLKNLNQLSQIFLEINTWKDIQYGHLTVDPLLIGAVKIFKDQFKSEVIRANKDADKTFSANQSLLCFMQIIYNHFDCIPDENLFKVADFIIQYNRYVQDTITQLQIQIHRKDFQNQLLKKKLTDLQGNKVFDQQARLALQNRIQAMVQAELNKKSACMALLSLIQESKFVKQSVLKKEKIKDNTEIKIPCISYDENLFFKTDMKEILGLNWTFLQKFNEKTNSLLERLSHDSDAKQEPIVNFIALIRDFNQCQTEQNLSQANHCLQTLIREISHCIYLQNYKGDISWRLYCFLVNYSDLITRFLHYLGGINDEYTKLANQYTIQIDQLQQKQATEFDLLTRIQQIIANEQLVDKFYQQIITEIAQNLFESANKMDSQQFSTVKPVLRSIFSLFGQFRDDTQSSESILVHGLH